MATIDYDKFEHEYTTLEVIDDAKRMNALGETKYVWTAVSGEGFCVDLMSGLHYVDRLYHVITEQPWIEDTYVTSWPEGAEYIEGETCGWCGNPLDEYACPTCTKNESVCVECCGCPN